MLKAQRKEREFNLRRSEILEQAEKIFAAKGFHNTAVAEIAEASGFAVGTLYQFFPSKEQLYISMLTEKLNMMYSAIRESTAKETDIIKKIEAPGCFSVPFRREQHGVLLHLHPGGSSVPLRGKRRAQEAAEDRL